MGDDKDGPMEGRNAAPKGQARDLGIMARLDEHLTPNQPQRSRDYKQMMIDEQFPRLDGPVSPRRVEMSVEEATDMVKGKAFELGGDLVGFTELDPRYIVRDRDVAGRWAVVVALAMDFDEIATAPEPRSGIEVTRAYYILGDIVVKLAAHIRSLGFRAIAHHPRSMFGKIGAILHKPTAEKAGLGEIGRGTLLITPEFGPRVRIATVSTELELEPTEPMDIGIAEFCNGCNRCLIKCPTGSIPEERRPLSPTGDPDADTVPLWRIDYDKCLPYFIRTDGCAVCIKECTFNKPADKALEFVERTLGHPFESRARPRR